MSGYKKAKKQFEKLQQGRGPHTLGYNDIVEYKHMDGTCARLHHASYVELAGDWAAICTEHNGSLLLNKGDLEFIRVEQWSSSMCTGARCDTGLMCDVKPC